MTAVDDQLVSPHAAVLYLVEMQFITGTQRLTNWSHNLEWAGHTWIGLGSVISVSGVSSSERLEYPALDLGMSVAKSEVLVLALGQVSTYRRQPVTLYQCVLDDEYRPLGDPELAWAGLMDQVRLKTGDGEKVEGGVVMRCEMAVKDSRGPLTLRLNNAQQQARYPGDTGLSRIEQMTGQPSTWLSVRFQRRD